MRESRAYRRAVRAAVRAHIARYGPICPGDDSHPRHPSDDLTADHPVAIINGGRVDGPLRVTCRSANSRKGAR